MMSALFPISARTRRYYIIYYIILDIILYIFAEANIFRVSFFDAHVERQFLSSLLIRVIIRQVHFTSSNVAQILELKPYLTKFRFRHWLLVICRSPTASKNLMKRFEANYK